MAKPKKPVLKTLGETKDLRKEYEELLKRFREWKEPARKRRPCTCHTCPNCGGDIPMEPRIFMSLGGVE